MSHTSQRRGLDPAHPGQELIVLAMFPSKFKNKDGIKSAMSELAIMMLDHHPHNWMSKNFTEIKVPLLGAAQTPIEWLHKQSPEIAERLLMRGVGYMSTVVTAIYTDTENVAALVEDLKKGWLPRNREKGYPISLVLSGLFGDIHQCCEKTALHEHTYLHSLGFFGSIDRVPDEQELEIITMCGHGLISVKNVRNMAAKIKRNEIALEDAAKIVTRPCVCGITNVRRATEIFHRIVDKND